MEYFLHSVDLPFSKIKLFYREINTKEQLLLAKIAILYPFGEDNDIDYITAFEKIIINCIENKEDFYKLNIIDYILFLTKLRILSIGKELELEFSSKNEEGMELKSTIDLEFFMKTFYDMVLKTEFLEEIKYNNIKIKLKWPNIKTKIFFLENKNNLVPTIPEFIDLMEIEDNKIVKFESFDRDQKEILFNKLPIFLKNKIQNKIIKTLKYLIDKNFFNISSMDWFKFNLYDSYYFHFLRLIFSYNLKTLYQEYYLMASKNINLSFVDMLPISDKKVYCSMIEEEFSFNNNESPSSYSVPEGNISLKKLIDEFER